MLEPCFVCNQPLQDDDRVYGVMGMRRNCRLWWHEKCDEELLHQVTTPRKYKSLESNNA